MCIDLIPCTYVQTSNQSQRGQVLCSHLISQQFCTFNYELEDYAEGIAKYHRCADQFSVNFTVAPNANMSSISTDVAQCNITNLERCKVYDIFVRIYLGDQVLDTVYDVDSVMTSKLGIATYRPCMVALQTIHLSLIWRLGLPLRHIQNNSLTFCKYSMNKVLPRVCVQYKPTPVMSYMYSHADNQLLLLYCNTTVKYICVGFIPCQEGYKTRYIPWGRPVFE